MGPQLCNLVIIEVIVAVADFADTSKTKKYLARRRNYEFRQKTLEMLTVINSSPRPLEGRCAPYISARCILFYSENEDGVVLHTDQERDNAIRSVKKICDLEFSLHTMYSEKDNANFWAHQLTTTRTKTKKKKRIRIKIKKRIPKRIRIKKG